MTAVEIVEGGPLGRSYPTVVVDGVTFTRKFGSWMAEHLGALREPVVFGVEPEDLQALAAVKAFDKERRALAAVAAPEPVAEQPAAREWAKGDRVMWAGSKARVIGPSKQEGKVRVKANRKVHHVDAASLTPREARR